MSKNILNEISRMRDLFGYKKGQVISEQEYQLSEQVDVSKLPLGTEGDFLDKLKAAGINGNSDPNFNKYYEWRDGIGSYFKRQTPLATTTKQPTVKPQVPTSNTTKQKSTTTDSSSKTLPNVNVFAIPQQLKDKEGVKKFQDWMDANHPNWVKGKNLNKAGGYGKFGPNTNKAWGKYKNEYISSIVKFKNTAVTDADKPVDDTQISSYAAKQPTTGEPGDYVEIPKFNVDRNLSRK
jgi:hypothetical protein